MQYSAILFMCSGSLEHLLPLPLLALIYVTASLRFRYKSNAVCNQQFRGILLYEFKFGRFAGKATSAIKIMFVYGILSETGTVRRCLQFLSRDESLQNAPQVDQQFGLRKGSRKGWVESDLVESVQDFARKVATHAM
ncbi:hypothetical protein Y032_0541g3192 [Ancylostoma ceylanicum]|uniref:Mos1 transposase HTH domain-containing protein n=1 Tax=Ancylostoma ceylanicum TaxID=53326 RepID=A0A016WT16_9BILA|nr:hypothetical protein Y032_0541g3192 [Ancylostoma ceylanicum]